MTTNRHILSANKNEAVDVNTRNGWIAVNWSFITKNPPR